MAVPLTIAVRRIPNDPAC